MLRNLLVLTPAGISSLQKCFLHGSRVSFALTGTARQEYIDSGLAKHLEKSKQLAKEYNDYVSQTTENWDKMHDIYYGKDRDMENFPALKMQTHHPKVRLGFIPDTWFTAFYDKTGVTGPYLFLWGGVVFLMQKEYLVADHQFNEVLPFFAAVAFVVKKFGDRISKFVDAKTQRVNYLRQVRPVEQLKKQSEEVIKHVDENLENTKAVKHIFDAKRENIEHQLEAVYRKRLLEIHDTVKRRLDFHVEREGSRRRFQQEHMVNWIVDSVVKGITPQQEKDALAQSIKDLKALAQKA